jgi:hypothetical protein
LAVVADKMAVVAERIPGVAQITIAAVGDVLLHGPLQRQAYAARDGHHSLWKNVEPLLSRADITTKRPERKKKGLRQISELADRIEAVQAEDAKVPPLPKGKPTVRTKGKRKR